MGTSPKRSALSPQEVSSISGHVLDSWALYKPPDWQPNLLARAIAQQLFISNYTKSSWIEDPGEELSCEHHSAVLLLIQQAVHALLCCDAGIPTQGYQLVYEPVFAALESEATILQTLTRLQNRTGLLTNLVNGVDTVVDSASCC